MATPAVDARARPAPLRVGGGEPGEGDGAEGSPRDRALLRALPWVAVAALFGFHLWLSSSVPGFFISDGTGYLANARWLAGVGGEHFQGRTGFYHPGYSLFLAPLFRLTTDPDALHQGVLVVNALLASASLLVYRALGLRLGLRPVPALLAGVVAATYPAVLLQASVEWSENLYHLAFGVLALLLHRLFSGGGAPTAAGAGLVTALLYGTHPRGLGLVPVVGVALAVLLWRRTLPRPVTATGLAALVAGFVAVRLLNGVLIDAMWAPDRPVTEGDVLSRLLEPHLLWGMVLRTVGHAWYLVVASAGLAVAAAAWLATRALRRPAGPDGLFARVVLAAVGATAAASALMMSDGTRVDHLVYGRYNEGFLPTLLVVGVAGVAAWHRRAQVAALGAAVAGSAVVLGALTVAGNGDGLSTGGVSPLNVLGLLVWEGDRGRVDVVHVTAGALAVVAVVLLVRLWSLRLSLVALAVFFAASAVLVRDDVLRPFTTYWASVHQVPDAVRALPTDEPVTYDREGFLPQAGTFYQLQLLDRDVRFWDPDDGPAPSALVISGRGWPRAGELGARLVFPEQRYDQALWVLPGPLQDRLVAGGLAFPGPPGAPIPEDQRVARLAGPARVDLEPGATRAVEVVVTHPGGGSPWAPLVAVPDATGAVRVAAVWPDGRTQLADLPTTVLGGQSVRVSLLLEAPPAPVEATVRVHLLQEGVGPFAGELTLAVRVR